MDSIKVSSVKIEPEFTPIISHRDEPILDQKDMTFITQIIVAALVSYILSGTNWNQTSNRTELAMWILGHMAVFTYIQHKLTNAIVKLCAKKKSPRPHGSRT